MHSAIRAIAVDYDGTIAEHDRAEPGVLAILEKIRADGIRLVLVTGRILDELDAVFPDARSRFDAIVAENGGVLLNGDGRVRTLGAPVSRALADDLQARGIPFRRGQVLLATGASQTVTIVEAIGRLGLDEQVLRNRDALMVLPARVSKGRGADEAFAELGISHHSAIGIGDAENDHALLSACEIGVAMENAVPALKARADIVLEEPGAAGLRKWLEGVHEGTVALHGCRRRVALGHAEDGTSPVLVPSSFCNLLVAGASGAGKSYVGGLLTERLVRAGYSVCVLDPEGDYTRLGDLRGVLTVGGEQDPPAPERLPGVVRHRLGSVVVDLSMQPADVRREYVDTALERLAASRTATGIPHWIVVDEAHVTFAQDRFAELMSQQGMCLVTYHPEELGLQTKAALDYVLFLAGSEGFARELPWLGADRVCVLEAEIEALPPRSALLLDLRAPGNPTRRFVVDHRVSAHVRHLHKYAAGVLPPERRFYFRDDGGRLLGVSACNVAELEERLASLPLGTVAHHVRSRDLSRWVATTLRDTALARVLENVEATASTKDWEETRHALLLAIHRRYAEHALAS